MTFENAAWAIDGALASSALARRAAYAGTSGTEGVVLKDDLKVTQLSTPGVGVQIAPGVALVLNDYESPVTETYVVSNPGVHTIPAGQMPASNPSAKSYIVAVVVGDPDFSQTGHPWMLATDPPAGEETTFLYVRPTIIEVAAGATTVPGNFPAYPLARIDVPANTTTIINSYITDLRHLAQPRQSQEIFVGTAWSNASPVYIPSATSFGDWGSAQYAPSVKVPSWAKRAILSCRINGVLVTDTSANPAGYVRAQLGSVSGPSTVFDLPTSGGAVRLNLEAAGTYDVSAIAGTTAVMRVEGYQTWPASPTTNQRLRLASGTQQIFDVRFFEE